MAPKAVAKEAGGRALTIRAPTVNTVGEEENTSIAILPDLGDGCLELQAADIDRVLSSVKSEFAGIKLSNRLSNASPEEAVEAIRIAFESLADEVEKTSEETAHLYAYVLQNNILATHPNPELRDPNRFLRSLSNFSTVSLSIAFYIKSTQRAIRGSRNIIVEKWGDSTAWFNQIPQEFRPLQISKRLYIEIAANAKQGLSPEESIPRWIEACKLRIAGKRQSNIQRLKPQTPYIIPDDIRGLNVSKIKADRDLPTRRLYPELSTIDFELRETRGESKTQAGRGGAKQKQKGGEVAVGIRKGKRRIREVLPPQDGDSPLEDDDGRCELNRLYLSIEKTLSEIARSLVDQKEAGSNTVLCVRHWVDIEYAFEDALSLIRKALRTEHSAIHRQARQGGGEPLGKRSKKSKETVEDSDGDDLIESGASGIEEGEEDEEAEEIGEEEEAEAEDFRESEASEET